MVEKFEVEFYKGGVIVVNAQYISILTGTGDIGAYWVLMGACCAPAVRCDTAQDGRGDTVPKIKLNSIMHTRFTKLIPATLPGWAHYMYNKERPPIAPQYCTEKRVKRQSRSIPLADNNYMLCQSRQPDTVHNITPPHMRAAVLRRVETKQNNPE